MKQIFLFAIASIVTFSTSASHAASRPGTSTKLAPVSQKAAVQKPSSTQMPNFQLPSAQLPAGQMPNFQLPTGQLPMGQIPQLPAGQSPMGQLPQLPTGNVTVPPELNAAIEEVRACTEKLVPTQAQIEQIVQQCASVDTTNLTPEQLQDVLAKCAAAPAIDPKALSDGLQTCMQNAFKKFGF